MVCGDGPRCTPLSVIPAVWRSWTPSPGARPRPASWDNGWGWARTCSRTTCACWKTSGWCGGTAPKVTGAAATSRWSGTSPTSCTRSLTGLRAGRVVFVCTQNSARSQLAASLWNDTSPVPATSAGTHPAPEVHPGAVAVARRRHLSLVAAPPRHLDDVLAEQDLVVTVCDNAHEELATQPAQADHDGVHWSIPDPVRAGEAAAFDRVVDELTDRIARLSPLVTPAVASRHPAEDRRTS